MYDLERVSVYWVQKKLANDEGMVEILMLAEVWLRCLLVAGSLIGAVRPDGGLLRQWGGIRARDFWTLGAFVPRLLFSRL